MEIIKKKGSIDGQLTHECHIIMNFQGIQIYRLHTLQAII